MNDLFPRPVVGLDSVKDCRYLIEGLFSSLLLRLDLRKVAKSFVFLGERGREQTASNLFEDTGNDRQFLGVQLNTSQLTLPPLTEWDSRFDDRCLHYERSYIVSPSV